MAPLRGQGAIRFPSPGTNDVKQFFAVNVSKVKHEKRKGQNLAMAKNFGHLQS